MSVSPSPDPKEVSELQFSSIGNFQIGLEKDEINIGDVGSSVAVSNKFGRLYLGCKNELVILDALSVEKSNAPEPLGRIPLPNRPHFVSLNADQTMLSVVVQFEDKPKIYLFDTRSLENKDYHPFLEIPDWTPPGTTVCDFAWNPVINSTFCVIYSNGSLALYLISDGKADLCTLPAAEGVTCVSWSPKGKQLVAGKKSGILTQYKPDLKEAKTIPCPPIGAPLSAVSVLWISTYQFAVGYQDSPSNRPVLYIVQSSKAGPTTYTNYDDITYASGESSRQRFSLQIINEWNIILCVSTCSMELAVLGGSQDNSVWTQWLFVNDRAEMPMRDHKDERYPIGMGVSFNSSKILTLTESTSLPHPMPILYLLSADGLLSCFYIKNVFNGSPNITCGASPFSQEGIRAGCPSIRVPKPVMKKENASTEKAVPTPSAPLAQTIQPFFPASTTPFGNKSTAPATGSSSSIAAPPFLATQGSTTGFGGLSTTSTIGISNAAPSTPINTPFSFSTPKPTLEKSVTPPVLAPSTTPSFGGLTKPAQPSKAVPSSNTSAKPMAKSTEPKSVPKENQKSEVPTKIFQKAIQDEIAFFQKEIEEFKSQGSRCNVEIGTEEDKLYLKKNTEEIDKFCTNVCEITSAQTKEISSLQNLNMEGFEWIEEARSREIRNNDPKYLKALRGRALDPLSQKKLDNVLSKYLYLDQQLREVNNVLDTEWEEHQDRSRMKKYKSFSSGPSKDTVFKALLSNSKALEAQKSLVESVVEKVNELAVKENCIRGYDSSFNNGVNEISDALEKSVLSLRNQKKKDEISSPIKTFSPKKEAALRQFLAQKGSVKVRSTRPSNLSESRFLKMNDKEELNCSKNLIQSLYSESSKENNQNNNNDAVICDEKNSALKETPKGVSSKDCLDELNSVNICKPFGATTGGQSLMGNSFASISKNASSTSVMPQKTVSSSTIGFGTSSTSSPIFSTNSISSTPSKPFIATTNVVSTTASSNVFASNKGSSPIVSNSILGSTTSTSFTTSSFGFGSGLPTSTTTSTAISKPVSTLSTNTIASTQSFSGVFNSTTPSFSFKSDTTTKTDSSEKTTTSFVTTSSTTSSLMPKGSITTPTIGSPSLSVTGTSTPSSVSVTPSSTVTSKTSVVSSTTTSLNIFGGLGISSTSSAGIFGSSSQDKLSTSNIFGSSSSATSGTSPGIFGGKSSSPNTFGASSSTTTTITASTTTSVVATTSTGVFSTTVASSAISSTSINSPSVFSTSTVASNQVATSTTTASSIFSTPVSSTGVFGTTKPSSTALTSSVFGSLPATSTTSVTSASTTTSGLNAFSKPADSSTSVFGSLSTTPSNKNIFSASDKSGTSIFGSSSTVSSPATTTGTPATTSSTTSSGVFSSSSSGIFSSQGASSTASSTASTTTSTTSTTSGSAPWLGSTGGNIFGGSGGTPFSSAGVFGQGSSPGVGSSSVFGGASSASTSNSNSIFGSGDKNSSIFGETKTSQAPASSIFNQNTTSSGIFSSSSGNTFSMASNSSTFGSAAATTTSSSSIFGASTTPSTGSVFGGGSTFGTTSASSQPFNNQSIFATSTSTSSPSSSEPFSGLGSASNPANNSKNIFGSSTTFGSSPASTNLFGGGGASSTFGNTGSSTPQTGMGSSFQNNANTPAQGFGSPKPSGGFGASPTFGGTPSFGGAPSFGGSPFGSNSNQQPTFGSTSPGSSTFGNLGSSVGGDGFGSLAAQSNTNTFDTGNSGSGFGGGSSFTSWR